MFKYGAAHCCKVRWKPLTALHAKSVGSTFHHAAALWFPPSACERNVCFLPLPRCRTQKDSKQPWVENSTYCFLSKVSNFWRRAFVWVIWQHEARGNGLILARLLDTQIARPPRDDNDRNEQIDAGKWQSCHMKANQKAKAEFKLALIVCQCQEKIPTTDWSLQLLLSGLSLSRLANLRRLSCHLLSATDYQPVSFKFICFIAFHFYQKVTTVSCHLAALTNKGREAGSDCEPKETSLLS